MCGPMALAVAATAFQAVNAYSQGQQQKQTAKANANIALQNAEIADRASQDALQRGADAASQEKIKARIANATLRTQAAAGGLLADTGTPMDLQTQNTGAGELNSLIVSNNAQRESYGFKLQKVGAINQANLFKTEAKTAGINSILAGTSALVTGAANYGNFGFFKKPEYGSAEWASNQAKSILFGAA